MYSFQTQTVLSPKGHLTLGVETYGFIIEDKVDMSELEIEAREGS